MLLGAWGSGVLGAGGSCLPLRSPPQRRVVKAAHGDAWDMCSIEACKHGLGGVFQQRDEEEAFGLVSLGGGGGANKVGSFVFG